MPDLVAIYALSDPRTRAIRYVGKAQNLHERCLQHLWYARKPRTHVQRWLAELSALQMQPDVSILEWVDEVRWIDAERAWIAKGRAEGWPLTNHADGGQGGAGHRGMHHSAESRERMSLAHKGQRNSPESVEKVAAQLRGRKRDPETAAKIAAARRGKPMPREAVEAIAAKKRGRKQSPELVEKRISKLRGKQRPAEVMEKAAKGHRRLTDEQIAQARALEKQGETQRKIAALLGVAQVIIWKALRGTKYAYRADECQTPQ